MQRMMDRRAVLEPIWLERIRRKEVSEIDELRICLTASRLVHDLYASCSMLSPRGNPYAEHGR
jgi:hypothetical protein